MSNHRPPSLLEKQAYYDFLKDSGCIALDAEADFMEKLRQEDPYYNIDEASLSKNPRVHVHIERLDHEAPDGEGRLQTVMGKDFAIVHFNPSATTLSMPWVGVLQADEAVITTFNRTGGDTWSVGTTLSDPENNGLLLQAVMGAANLLSPSVEGKQRTTQWTVLGDAIKDALVKGMSNVRTAAQVGEAVLGVNGNMNREQQRRLDKKLKLEKP